MIEWTLVGQHWYGPNGESLPAISGGGEGGGGGAGAAGAMGGMSNIDFTFGQKGVYDDRTKKELAMLLGLMQQSGQAGSRTVNTGQTPGAAPAQSWNPAMLLSLARMFGGGGGGTAK